MGDVYSTPGHGLPDQGITITGAGQGTASGRQAMTDMLKRSRLHLTHRYKETDEKS